MVLTITFDEGIFFVFCHSEQICTAKPHVQEPKCPFDVVHSIL